MGELILQITLFLFTDKSKLGEVIGGRNQAAIGFEIKAKKMFNYPAALTKDGESILVTFRDVPEAITFGANKEEVLLNAVDALETGLSTQII